MTFTFRNPVNVLPTCVGMVRPASAKCRQVRRSPHVRGDGPSFIFVAPCVKWFSPRAWGWSAFKTLAWACGFVLPTCVGMVRYGGTMLIDWERSPHVRGDGPSENPRMHLHSAFSPRAWGWSELKGTDFEGEPVLPTCVGMVRSKVASTASCRSSPHVRGDGPS